MTRIAVLRLAGVCLAAAFALNARGPLAAAPAGETEKPTAGDGVAHDTLSDPGPASGAAAGATPGAQPEARSVPDTTGAISEPASPPAEPPTKSTEAQPAGSPAEATPPVVTAPPTDATPAAAAAAAPSPQQPAVDPVVNSIRQRLADTTAAAKADPADIAALQAFYAARNEPLWTKSGGYTDTGKAIIAELKKADDWGLNASAYAVADTLSGAAPEAQGAAEATLAVAALRYARDARGGRIDPRGLSNIFDVGGEIKDPVSVLADLSASSTPDQVLRGLHPKHPEFEALRQALLKARGADEPAPEPVDEALLVKLPDGGGSKSLKAGIEHDDVVLLRKRLKVAVAAGGNERVYDETLAEAVKGFQAANGLKATGTLNRRTRQALNAEGEPKTPPDKKSTIDNLIVNMERWRWLPVDLGNIYVWNNIPEFVGRVMKDGKPVFEERIIVGQPTWPTPMLTDSMEKVVFRPEWGVPDGIKVKELLPRLKRASAQYGFFDQLFGGGSSGGARVLEAYGLTPSLNGRPVDANSVDWNNVDIRRFSFVQPAGVQNPLGQVKFMFPNRHDVYMHDTSQRNLFAASRRALSHGCIRVQNPKRLAEVLLGEDKGWTTERVEERLSGGGEVSLDRPVPVYLTYFTARPAADGTIKTFGDVYGHDGRILSALAGKPVRYNPPDHSGEDVSDDATIVMDETEAPVQTTSQKKKNKQAARKKYDNGAGDVISNALSGLLFN